MKMKRFVAAAAALLIMVSMIGSGFSYWYFSNGSTTADQNLSKEVTQLIEIGKVTAANNFKLVFDQTNTGRTSQTDSSLTNLGEAKGIWIDWNEATDHTASYESSKNEGVTDTVSGVVKYKFTVTITLSSALAKFVDVTYYTTSDKTEVSNTWTKARSSGNESDPVTITFTAENTKEFDWDCVQFTYFNSSEPTSQETYGNLRKAVSADNSIKVSYAVNLING